MEAGRAILAKIRMQEYFWLEVINTTCYTYNRSLNHSTLKKTLYQLQKGRKPNIGYSHNFGYTCYILNNGNTYLTKFQAKFDEYIFLGYSTISEEYRVFNKCLLITKESIYITFDETNIVELSKTCIFDEIVEQDQEILEQVDPMSNNPKIIEQNEKFME